MELRNDGQGEVSVLVRVVGAQAQDELAFDVATGSELARHLRGLVAGEMPSPERNGVQALGIDGKPLHLGLHLHVLRDDDDRIGVSGTDRSASRYSSHLPMSS